MRRTTKVSDVMMAQLNDGDLAMIATALRIQVDFWRDAQDAPDAVKAEQVRSWSALLDKVETL
jgi:hypothetical protein